MLPGQTTLVRSNSEYLTKKSIRKYNVIKHEVIAYVFRLLFYTG